MWKLFKKETKPNIVMMLIDQLRYDRLDQSGIFEQLKSKGVFFPEMITYAPYTIASMYATFTGIYGSETGVNSNYATIDFDKDHCFTLPQYLKESGYCTFSNLSSELHIPLQDIDDVNVYDEQDDNCFGTHLQQINKAVKKKPFFLYLHYSDIHRRMLKDVIRKYDNFSEEYFNNIKANSDRYNKYVAEIGEEIKILWDLFLQKNLLDETIFIILTDHGCSTGERVGEKCYGVFTYEYTIRGFCYLIYQKMLPQGVEIKNAVRTVDILPSILDLLGIKQKSDYRKLHGESLLPLINGKENADREAFIETGSIRGPYPSEKPNIKCIRANGWKLIYNTTIKQKELYNLKQDPLEDNNVIDQYPDIEKKLWLRLNEYDAVE